MLSMFGIKDYIFAGIVITLLAYVGVLKFENNSLTSQNTVLGDRITSFTAITRASKIEADTKKEEVIKEVEVIKWKTQTKIKTIKEYIRDENLTDCNNAMSFSRSFF